MIERNGTGMNFTDRLLVIVTFMVIVLFGALNAAEAMAQSGVYFNPERDGEGGIVLRDKTFVVVYMFTYDEGGDQAWYFLSEEWNNEKNEATGFIYRAESINWPDGEPLPDNPFGVEVGEAKVVGIFVLEPSKTGYRMLVLPFGDELNESDPLFEGIHDWSFRIFEPTQ